MPNWKYKWQKLHGSSISFYISGNDLAYIDDYFVRELGVYPNRSEFIRIAIKNQIDKEIKKIIFKRDNIAV